MGIVVVMISKLYKKYKQIHLHNNLLQQFDKSYGEILVEAERSIRTFGGALPAPFLTYLEVSGNFLSYIQLLPKAVPDYSDYPLREKIDESKRDMMMLQRNFDVLVTKKLCDAVELEKSKPLWQKRHVLDIVSETFLNISYLELSYREWAIDAAERVSNCYVNLRVLTNVHGQKYPVLENMLYSSLIGYKIDRMNLMYNAAAIVK